MPRQRHAWTAARNRRDHRYETWQNNGRERERRPDERGFERKHPACRQRQKARGRADRPTQIVDHLPATDPRKCVPDAGLLTSLARRNRESTAGVASLRAPSGGDAGRSHRIAKENRRRLRHPRRSPRARKSPRTGHGSVMSSPESGPRARSRTRQHRRCLFLRMSPRRTCPGRRQRRPPHRDRCRWNSKRHAGTANLRRRWGARVSPAAEGPHSLPRSRCAPGRGVGG